MGETAEELPRVLQLLWGIDEPNRPGPKPGLSITGIGAAAVRIADAHGLGAVSMSKVAAELGFTTMSLYRYVSSKDDLYVVMVEEAFGRPELGDLGGEAGWRERITAWATAVRDAIRRHPWILQVPISEPPLSPKQLEWMEAGLRAFEGTALTEQDRLSSMVLVNIYVRGVTQLTMNMFSSQAAANLTGQEADLIYARRLARLADPDRFPMVAGAVLSGALEDDSDFGTDEFLFGLRTVLDGVATLIHRRHSTAP
ncbi:MAG TPA: TetR/AcrR family transcriptional regulator [Kribbella sp.]|nr:TetR/AcrR family transcriptional regulator [Kribbella sp.]